jgi:uncharacterized coiled-coil protein SlyX
MFVFNSDCLQMVPSEEEIARLEQKQRQAFQERVLKDISNPLLVKTNDRISQMQDWKNNVALLSPRVPLHIFSSLFSIHFFFSSLFFFVIGCSPPELTYPPTRWPIPPPRSRPERARARSNRGPSPTALLRPTPAPRLPFPVRSCPPASYVPSLLNLNFFTPVPKNDKNAYTRVVGRVRVVRLQVARSAPDLVREMSDDAGDTVRSNTSQQLHLADREHSRDDAVTSAGSRGATDDADHPPNKRPEANAAVPPTTAAAPVAAAPHGGSGESHPRRDEREQRADWLDIIHFYLHRNLDKIRVLMQAPELHVRALHVRWCVCGGVCAVCCVLCVLTLTVWRCRRI